DFLFSSNDCPPELGPGSRCTVGVRFAPATVGAREGAALEVAASPGGAAAASLDGVGTALLTVALSGKGRVVSEPDGIDCPGACAATFSVATVDLTGTPEALNDLAWSGGGCAGAAPCTVTLDAAKTVTATFTPRPAALDLAPAGQNFG